MLKVLSNWCNRYLSDPEAVGILASLVIIIVALKTMGNILAPLVAGIVISYMLSSGVKRLVKWRFPNILAVSIVYLIFLSVLLFIFIWLIPLLWEQLNNLLSEIPGMFSKGQMLFGKLTERYPEYFSGHNWQQVTTQLTSYLGNFGKTFLSYTFSSLLSIVTLFVYLILVPLLVFFFLRDARTILNWTKKFLPTKQTATQKIWQEVHQKIGSYIKGKIVEIIIVGIATSISFALLGLSYSVLLGFLVGLSVVIPYIGIVLVTIPIVIVGVLQWGFTEHFFYLMIVYAVISILDANVLVPLLFAEAMKLHPIAIIFAVLLFGSFAGFWGVFFAIPLMTFFNALIKWWPVRE